MKYLILLVLLFVLVPTAAAAPPEQQGYDCRNVCILGEEPTCERYTRICQDSGPDLNNCTYTLHGWACWTPGPAVIPPAPPIWNRPALEQPSRWYLDRYYGINRGGRRG
jgi:hypothetical protein